MNKLVIDLGHGGNDSGAVGQNRTKESEIVFEVGKYIKEFIKLYDIDCKFTRADNKYVLLNERTKIANKFNGEYFISIHVNSSLDKKVRGTEVWLYSDNNNKMNEFSKQISKDISGILKIHDRGVKYSKDLFVLRNTNMPACLIEIDFISNIDGEKALNNKDNIKSIGSAIVKNIVNLYNLEVKDEIKYKVCIGSYNEKEEADNQVKIAKSKGFTDAHIL